MPTKADSFANSNSAFKPNYMDPGKFAAGLRSTDDRNSAGYMGKRSTIVEDTLDQSAMMKKTFGRKFNDLEPVKTKSDQIREYE